MASSVVTCRYGTYTFNPVPQIGIRESRKRLGANATGPGPVERNVTLKGKLYGINHAGVQAEIVALRNALKQDDLALYWHDGSTVRINTSSARVQAIEIPEEWGQYEVDYTIRFTYYPNDETHMAALAATYGGYTFNPIPIMAREYEVKRASDDSDERKSTKVTLTLQGFIAKGSVSGNWTEWNTLCAALAADGSLTYGGLTQSVRIKRYNHAGEIGDTPVAYTVVCEYDADVGGDGVKQLVSSRNIINSERVAVHYIPFMDNAQTPQRMGRNGQTIQATGYIVAESLAEALAAAYVEIEAQFPVGGIETEPRSIRESASEKKVEWNVTKFYATPVLTGGAYGGAPVF